MAVETVGELVDLLCDGTPRRVEHVVECCAAPADVVLLAIQRLESHGKIVRVRQGEGLQIWHSRRISPPARKMPLEAVPDLVGAHQRRAFRTNLELDEMVETAARSWRLQRNTQHGDFVDEAVSAQAFLASQLGRAPTDREMQVFWIEADNS